MSRRKNLSVFEENTTKEADKLIYAVGYVRYSSDNQRPESNVEQTGIILKFAKEKGITVLEVFSDDAVSGTSTKGRTGLEKMIDFIKKNPGKVRYVIGHKVDRMARDVGDYYAIKKELKRYGVDMIFVNDGLSTENPESILHESLLTGVAAYHSINLSREVMRGLEYNAENCMSTGGKPPLGYEVDPDTLKYVVNEAEAEIVKLIFKRYGMDGYSYAEIAEELNNKGYTTKRGNKFKKNSLIDLLKNEKYRGIYTYNKAASKDVDGKRNGHKSKADEDIIRVEGGCPRIISDELWNLVQERKKCNASYSTKHFYPLKDKIYCGECGSKMGGNHKPSGSNKKRYTTYDCIGRKNDSGCTNKGINAEYIEQFVTRQLKHMFVGDKAIKELTNIINQHIAENRTSVKKAINDAKRQLRIVQDKINNIVKSVENGRSLEPFEERLKGLNVQKTNLNAHISNLYQELNAERLSEKDIIAIRNNFVDTLLTDEPLSRIVIQRYVNRVIVYQNRVEVFFNSYRNIRKQ